MNLFDSFDPGAATDFFQATRGIAFSPNDASYNRGNARWLARLSRLMYVRNANARRPFLTPQRISEVELAGTNSTAVAIFRGSGFDVLAFRGTQLDSLHGFLDDVISEVRRPFPIAWPPHAGRVHDSISSEFLSAWPEIDGKLRALPDPQPLFFAGHSLGGALATLASAVSRTRVPRATYTFGAPRIGDAEFVASIQPVPLHRVENAHDPIPTTTPPSTYRTSDCTCAGRRHSRGAGRTPNRVTTRATLAARTRLSKMKSCCDSASKTPFPTAYEGDKRRRCMRRSRPNGSQRRRGSVATCTLKVTTTVPSA